MVVTRDSRERMSVLRTACRRAFVWSLVGLVVNRQVAVASQQIAQMSWVLRQSPDAAWSPLARAPPFRH